MSNAARKARKKQHHTAIKKLELVDRVGYFTRTKVYREAKAEVESTRFVSDKGQRERRTLHDIAMASNEKFLR